MAKLCDVCGKKPMSGNNVSHAHNKTRRKWYPNIHKTKVMDKGTYQKDQCLHKVPSFRCSR